MKTIKSNPISHEEKATWPEHGLVKLAKPFGDERGSITPLVDMMMKSAVLIESKAGSLRANHYHKTDWHYCYVVLGLIEYYHRPTGSKQDPDKISVSVGEMVFTPPMVDHSMIFPVDTIFLALSRNPRDQKSYEADVVRVNLVSEDGLTHWKPKKTAYDYS